MSDHAHASPGRPVAVAAPASPAGQRSLLEQVIQSTTAGGFDPDAWHVLDKRDDTLIEQDLLSGSGSSKFVYSFSLQGTNVVGVSVVGARHLAYHYGGLRHRMIASTEKRGALFTFITYPGDGAGMRVETSYLHDLADEDDFYSCLIEMEDVKKGNRIQVEKRETRREKKRDGGTFERPHFQVIAQSKAYRNAVLALVPQDVQLQWREQQLKLGKGEVVTASVADEKRNGVLRYAAGKGIGINRQALEALTLDQLSGLGDAAREGDGAFRRSALALGILVAGEPTEAPGEAPAASAPPADPKPRQPRQPRQAAPERVAEPPPPREEPPPPADDGYGPETGEVLPPPGEGEGEMLFR